MEQLDAIQVAKDAGASEEQLKPALELQRKAQWRLDFIAAENSMGFHAPQEAAKVLAEAADYARQGQIAALNWNAVQPVAAEVPAVEETPEAGAPAATE
jgi:nitrite reductase (cytochrome c-552)